MSAKSSSPVSGDRPRLFLIDGTSNVFRAFFAIRNLSTSKGEPTNAVFGFLQMLRKLLKDEEPAYIGVAFDVSADTHRKDKYEDYKANRRPMPDDLRPQPPLIRQVVEAFNIPILEMPKYEADDVLGTPPKGGGAGLRGDPGQPGQGPDAAGGRKRQADATLGATGSTTWPGSPKTSGCRLSKVIDVLALQGRRFDNVPGVPGIGEKGRAS